MRTLLWGLSLLLAASRASAADAEKLRDFQETVDDVLRGYYETAGGRTLTETARLAYGAYTTFAFYADDDEAGHTRVFREIDSKLWLRAERMGHLFYGRLRLQYDDFNSGDELTPSGDGFVYPLFDRYWYRFDWRTDERAEWGTDPGWNWWVQAGRQHVEWASGLALSDPLYAARGGVETASVGVEAILGVTPDSFLDFDGSRPGYDSDTERYFWGLLLEYRGLRGHRPFLYFLAQEDNNGQPFPPGAPEFLYESRYVGAGSTGGISTGTWLYRLELVYEFGDSISNAFGPLPQSVDSIGAYAARLYVAYMPPAARERVGLRIESEILVGSGDDDRATATQTAGGNLAGTTDRSFIAFGYVNTGLALAPELANLLSFRVTASAFPLRGHGAFDRMRVSVSGFVFAKYDEDAPISVATLPGESLVGGEIDLLVEWLLTSDVAVNLQYGLFLPGSAIADSDPLHFLYAGLSYGF